jgi:hypothetical protein
MGFYDDVDDCDLMIFYIYLLTYAIDEFSISVQDT